MCAASCHARGDEPVGMGLFALRKDSHQGGKYRTDKRGFLGQDTPARSETADASAQKMPEDSRWAIPACEFGDNGKNVVSFRRLRLKYIDKSLKCGNLVRSVIRQKIVPTASRVEDVVKRAFGLIEVTARFDDFLARRDNGFH